MLSTHLTQFLKNTSELLERRKVDLEKSDENIMYHFVSFLTNVFNDSVTTVDGMQLSEVFKQSIVKDLHAICGDILKLISHLSPEVKSADCPQELEMYNLKKPFVENSFVSDLFKNPSTRFDDFYWNSEDFVPFDVVQESCLISLEKPVFKKEDLSKIQHIVNNTKYRKTEPTGDHIAGNENGVSKLETSKSNIENNDPTKKSFTTNSMRTETSLSNSSIDLLPVPKSFSDENSLTESRALEEHLTQSTINHISVRSFNTLDDLSNSQDPSTRYISILNMNNLAAINTSFTIDKMGFHSIVKAKNNKYKCLLCSAYTSAKAECLNNHLQSLLHMDNLAKDIIWVSSLGIFVNTDHNDLFQCCICWKVRGMAEMNNHLKSNTHRQLLSSAAASFASVLEEMENVIENKDVKIQMLTSYFQMVLEQHKIKVIDKDLACSTCGDVKIPMSLYELYTHIAGQQHWRPHLTHLKKYFVDLPEIRNGADRTQRGYINVYRSKDMCYCQICKVLIDGVSKDVIDSHLKSYAHSKFYLLFLKNGEISAFVDLNEGSGGKKFRKVEDRKFRQVEVNKFRQVKGKQFSFPSATRGKSDINASKAKLKIDTSEKTKNDDSVSVHDTGSRVIVNYNLAIDKYSWNGMKMNQYTYTCAPCGVTARVSECPVHIALDSHKTRLSSCPLDLKNLTRKMENIMLVFCVVCGDWVQEEETTDHPLDKHHKARMEQFTLKCENLKKDMNHNIAKMFFLTFGKANHKIFADILKQNQFIFLSQSSYEVFCKLCSRNLFVDNFQVLYEHITCFSHFSAFVASKDMYWVMKDPRYMKYITGKEDNNISYCLICNFTLPSESVAVHQNSGVHKYLLPLFIENVFSHHHLKYIIDTVVCNLCEKKLSKKSVDIHKICDHIKDCLHVTKHKQILKSTFCDMSGIKEISLDLLKPGIQRFQQYDICYCSTCNVLFKGASEASIIEHTDSKIHYVFCKC